MTVIRSRISVKCKAPVKIPGRDDIQITPQEYFQVPEGTKVVYTDDGGRFVEDTVLLAAIEGRDLLGTFRFTGYPVRVPANTEFQL